MTALQRVATDIHRAQISGEKVERWIVDHLTYDQILNDIRDVNSMGADQYWMAVQDGRPLVLGVPVQVDACNGAMLPSGDR